MKLRPGWLDGLFDARLCQHAAIADKHDAFEPKLLFELVDLGCDRRGIADVAFENLDRDRAAFGRAKQSDDDLQLAALAVAIVAPFGQGAGAAFEIGGGDVVENQRAVVQMPPRQRLLDALPADPINQSSVA